MVKHRLTHNPLPRAAAILMALSLQYARHFNPVEFDAREWVRIAKDAGTKYIIITSKHHEGFVIFDSDVSEYDIMARRYANSNEGTAWHGR